VFHRFFGVPYYQIALPLLRRLNFARPSAFDWAAYYLQERHIPVTGIVDAGAFEADLFPSARIYAFEPSPASFARLEQAIRRAPRITAFPLALGDRNGRAELNVNRSPGTNSLLPILPSDEMRAVLGTGGEMVERVSVETVRLDDFLQREQNKRGELRCTVLKSDTQGFELNVLRGARETLQQSICAVIAEIRFFSPAYQGDTSMLETIDAFLAELGFELQCIPSISPHPVTHRAFEADALWIRSRGG
jgi:FkbM family methyltransferase